jgi:glucosylceramidase
VRDAVDGLSYHCYHVAPGGRARVLAALDGFRAAFPGKSLHETECTQHDTPTWGRTIDILIGHTRHGAATVGNWNLALDPAGGPQSLTCGTLPEAECADALDRGSRMSAPVVVAPRAGRLAASFTREYYEMGQVSKFVRPGAVRIGSTELDGIENVAFENPDGSRVLVAHNSRAERAEFAVNVDASHHLPASLPPGGIATWRWVPN